MTTDRRTGRWWFAAVAALLAGAVGAATARPLALLVGAVAVGYATAARAGAPPEVDLSVERTLSDPEPLPGEAVAVTVRVRNEGSTLWDLRLVDGVPAALTVVEGSPRHATALRPGGAVTFDYAVRAQRGQHGFDPPTVVARDPTGAVERETTAESETILTCLPPLSEVPLRSQTTQLAGRITTDTGGEGLEFHATREYRPGDALSRIDWNQRARTGELSTIEFREERAAAVVLVVDARPEAYWTRTPGEHHAVEHGVAAAGRVFAELLDAGDQVGLAALGDEDCWLPAGAGSAHEHRARHLLATHPALSYAPPADGPPELTIDPDHEPVAVDWLRSRLDADAQVVLFSPACDDGVAEAAHELHAAGHAVTMVSPDVVPADTPGGRLAAVQRRNRLHAAREAGVRVVDWDTAEELSAALVRTEATP